MNQRKIIIKLTFLFVVFGLNVIFSQTRQSSINLTDANLRSIETTGFVRCATVEYKEKSNRKEAKGFMEGEFESWMANKIKQTKINKINAKIASEIYTIPVVVHVVHNGDNINSVGNVTGVNISDAQIETQIAVLNQDFRMLADTPGGANTTGAAVDIGINFSLAKQDLEGNEITGIVRHDIEPYTNEFPDVDGISDWENLLDVENMKIQTIWDPTKYFNIWVLNMGGADMEDGGLKDLLGYAQFPRNSDLEGLESGGVREQTDGVVLAYHTFGDIKKNDGSFVMGNLYNEGRTATHEVGHWLGLLHVFGESSTCENHDYCDDTPDVTEPHYECNLFFDTCVLDGLGNDMVQNYMDYTNDACMDTFTQNQKDRMRVVIENSPRRVELLTSETLNLPLYDNNELDNFIIDPNPFSEITTVAGFVNGVVKISVFNTYGNLVFYKEYENTKDKFIEEVDLSVLETSGVYILLVQDQERQVVKRIIKL